MHRRRFLSSLFAVVTASIGGCIDSEFETQETQTPSPTDNPTPTKTIVDTETASPTPTPTDTPQATPSQPHDDDHYTSLYTQELNQRRVSYSYVTIDEETRVVTVNIRSSYETERDVEVATSYYTSLVNQGWNTDHLEVYVDSEKHLEWKCENGDCGEA